MGTMTVSMPPGWYPDQVRPDSLRYWDGQEWTSKTALREPEPPAPLDEPSAEADQVLSRPHRHRRRVVVGSVIAVLAFMGVVATAGVLSHEADVTAVSALSSTEPTRSVTSPSPTRAEAARTIGPGDAFYVSLGYSVIETGRIYVLPYDPEDFTCGSYRCMYYTVVALGGCPGGLYVEASILSGDVVVGMSNDLVGGVAAGEDARVFLEDYAGGGDAFRISEVSCY